MHSQSCPCKSEEQITYFEYTMAQSVHYHYEKTLDQSKAKTQQGKTQTPVAPYLTSKGLDGLPLPALLTVTHLSLVGWLHFLSAAILERHHMALASPTSWRLPHSPGFTFTASWNELSEPPCGDSPATHVASVWFLNIEEEPTAPLLLCSIALEEQLRVHICTCK